MVPEGQGGTVTASFTARLSEPSAQTVTVAYASANGTATAGADYVSASGTLTFAPGTTTRRIDVTVNGDALDEPDETFVVNLSLPTNAALADAQAIGVINDDDVTPSLSISDVAMTEGNAGFQTATFTVALSAPSGQPVSVSYATADGTATTADGDYTAAAGTLTFAPGVASQSIAIAVTGDTTYEFDEVFFVNLGGPVNVTIAGRPAVGAIANDDPLPPPGPTTPLSPSGITSTTTPAFSWSAVPFASYYSISVTDADPASPTVAWYTPVQAGCASGTGTCSVAAPRALYPGLVSWRALTWNAAGYGPWSATQTAVVEVPDPSVPTPVPGAPMGSIATRTPTYTWSPVASATWYQLSVTDALGTVREFWAAPAAACASSPCAFTPNDVLALGPAQWMMRAWRVSGAGAWSASVGFETTSSPPGRATLVSPLTSVATQTPSFTWNAVLGVNYYLVRVTDRDNVSVDTWYVPSAAGCPHGTGTCVVSPNIVLKAGKASWSVLTYNSSGYGPWSETREFAVEIADPTAPTPAAVSPNGTMSSANVTYRWTAVAGALSYRIAIRNNGGAPTYWWYSSVAAGCQSAAECSAVPWIMLINGTADLHLC